MNQNHIRSFHKNNKNKNNVFRILNDIKKYEINNHIFEKYDEIKKMGNVGNNIRRTQKNYKIKCPRNNSNTDINIKYNDGIEFIKKCNTNFDILKHFISNSNESKNANVGNVNNNECKKRNFDDILENFNNEGINENKNTQTNTIEYEFQKYKVKLCELIQENTSTIKSIKLNPNKIYERVLEKNYKSKHTNDYEYNFDIFMALLYILNI
jgi:hypothetical protein